MSREDVVQAQYWQGALTRAEAQHVFDENAQALMNLAQETMKLKAVVSYFMDKFSITAGEIDTWVTAEVAKVKTEQLTKAQEMQTVLDAQAAPKVTLD